MGNSKRWLMMKKDSKERHLKCRTKVNVVIIQRMYLQDIKMKIQL